jgi:hypothetical protein
MVVAVILSVLKLVLQGHVDADLATSGHPQGIVVADSMQLPGYKAALCVCCSSPQSCQSLLASGYGYAIPLLERPPGSTATVLRLADAGRAPGGE